LSSVSTEFEGLQETLKDIKLELTVYVTCDESFTEEHKSLLSAVIAPNHELPPQAEIEHGVVEYRGRPQSTEQEQKQEEKFVREVNIDTSDRSERVQNACRPDGTCCCRTAVDETSPDNIESCCCCSSKKVSDPSSTSRPNSQISSTPSSTTKPKLLVHPSIKVYSGRPKTRDIIRKSLEQALGESAVVVCGPHGLVTDIKQDVCALSDERAVHKGTGAQGIYLHTESFSY
jgi:hypothetical protein